MKEKSFEISTIIKIEDIMVEDPFGQRDENIMILAFLLKDRISWHSYFS